MFKQDLEEGQLLRSDRFNITVRVLFVDVRDNRIPVKVEYVDGDMKVNTGYDCDPVDSFANDRIQWLYADAFNTEREYLVLTDLEPVEL